MTTNRASPDKTVRSQDGKLTTFPAFMRVADRRVLIVGGGAEAFAKARLVANTSAAITVRAPELAPDFAAYVDAEGIAVERAAFSADALSDCVLVFAATGNETEDAAIAAAAREARIPVNAVDQIEACDFFTPGLINRAPLAIAIGTEGAGPVLGQIIRARIDALLDPSLGRLATLGRSYRVAVERLLPQGQPRRRFWRSFFTGDVAKLVARSDISNARRAATRLLRQSGETEGHVSLVGAGPGAEDLLTLRAHRLLMEADVIVHDALVPQAVVDMGRRDAERIAVGKRKGCHSKSQDEINALLVELGQDGKRVVRLKSGDPMIFGRAAEEIAALRQAGISYDIVPGVTAVTAAAADFELPVTLRGIASTLIVTNGHDLHGAALPDWAGLAVSGATIALYMGRSVAAPTASRLIEAGLSPDTPVAIAENASRPDRRLFHTVLADLPRLSDRSDITGAVIIVIGDAVAAANLSRSQPLQPAAQPIALQPQRIAS
jgi:uroporphyrin-III C-methyltransferase/precorrin-2 dehydrogenase/sirohydrochlorin ferrochelatase